MGLHQVLCLHIIAFNLSFSWDFWICETIQKVSDSCALSWDSSIYWVAFFGFSVIPFIFSCIFYRFLFMLSCYHLLVCSFLTRERGKQKVRGEGRMDTERRKRRGNFKRIYCKKESILFLHFFVFPIYFCWYVGIL